MKSVIGALLLLSGAQTVSAADCFSTGFYSTTNVASNGIMNAASAEACQQLCQINSQCAAFNFKQLDGTCHLKTDLNNFTPDDDHSCGPKNCGAVEPVLAYGTTDGRSGCPNILTATGTALISETIEMATAGSVFVSVEMIRHAAGRKDVELRINGVKVNRGLTYSSIATWESSEMMWAGSLASGTHTVEMVGLDANIWGCRGDWGNINVVKFEGGNGMEAWSVDDNRGEGCPQANPDMNTAIMSETVTMEEDGSLFVMGDTISYASGRRDLGLFVDGVQVRKVIAYTDSLQWDQSKISWAGALAAGVHTIELRPRAVQPNFGNAHQIWGCPRGDPPESWGKMSLVKFDHNIGSEALGFTDQLASNCPTTYTANQDVHSTVNINMEQAGSIYVMATIISESLSGGDGRRDMKLLLDDVEVRVSLVHSDENKWESLVINYAGPVAAGAHTLRLIAPNTAGFGCGEEWGSINVMNIGGALVTASPTTAPTGTPTGTPTTATPTAAPSTAAAMNNEQTPAAAGSIWKTAQIGDTVYKQNEITGITFSNSYGARGAWNMVNAAVASAMADSLFDTNLNHSVTDGSFEVDPTGVTFNNLAGDPIYTFSWDCVCADA